jgi:transcriptional regulator of arginine metabolism
MTADRRKRQLKILELISTRPIRTQEELADVLAAEGWNVTQSSVSRDIAALRLAKVDGAYQRPSRLVDTPEHPDERRIVEGVLSTYLPLPDRRATPSSSCILLRARPTGLARRSTGWRGVT